MSEALTIQDPTTDLKLWRPPEQVLVEAHQAAVALQKRIAGKKKPVIFNGEQYIEYDDWQMLAQFFGYVPKVESTEFVDFGSVKGFKATAILLNEHTGMAVSRAESMCLDEEENWGPRPKYEWKDVLGADGKPIWDKNAKNGQGGYRREKVQVGQVNTPLFQLLSMAQTRACAKACRNKLAWVVSLAGYQTTPAEEVTDNTVKEEAPALPTEIKRKESPSPAASRDGSSAKGEDMPHQPHATPAVQGSPHTTHAPRSVPPGQVPPPQPSRERVISEPQARRFYAICKSAGKDKEEVNSYLLNTFGISTDREIPASRYNDACAWAEGNF